MIIFYMAPAINQERRAGEAGSESSLASAIDSIPGYIARCKFFFALCPVVESESLGKVFTGLSWGERGWCRIERVLRELSPDPSWIMIKGNTELELTASSSACFIVQSAGEGQFTRKDDRTKLAQVLQHALRRKLRLLLMAEDLVGYRVHLNLQSIHLRGFPAEATDDLVPGFEPDSFEQDACTLSAQRFLYQNGFATVHEVDAGGWSPGHYAALRGDPLVMQGLLQLRADINRWTRKDQPVAGSTVGFTMLGTAAFFKHHQLMRLLISARPEARILSPNSPKPNPKQPVDLQNLTLKCFGISARAKTDFGLHPDMAGPACANDPEGVRI